MASHAALTIVIVFIAVVYIMIGRARGLCQESKEAFLLLENHLLSFFLRICREKIFLFIRKDIFVGFGVLLYTLYLMTGLAGDGFSLLDGIVCKFAFARDEIMVGRCMALGACVISFLLGRMPVPDGLVETICVDRAVGMDRALVFSIDLGVTGFAGGILQRADGLCGEHKQQRR